MWYSAFKKKKCQIYFKSQNLVKPNLPTTYCDDIYFIRLLCNDSMSSEISLQM